MEKLIWCFSIKTGLRLTRPDEGEQESYKMASAESLREAKKAGKLWRPVMLYYAAYHRAYAILRMLGLKSENHSCTIFAIGFIERFLKIDKKLEKRLFSLLERRKEVQYKLKEARIDENEVIEVIKDLEELEKEAFLRRNEIRKAFEHILTALKGEEEI